MAIEPQNPLVWAWSVAWMPQQPIAPTVWQPQQTNNNLLLPYQQIPWLDTNFNTQQQPTQPIQITIPQQQPQGWQQPIQQTQPVQPQNTQQGSFQQPRKPVQQNQNTEPLWLAWLWAWPAFPWFASEYVKWKFDDLPTLDIAKGLSDWTIKDSDLKWMSFLNPDKFSQVQKAKTTIVSYDQANKLASWDIGKSEKDKTQQIIKDSQALPQSVQTAIQTWSNLADKLTKLYDQQINTPEMKKITDDMGNLDREIVKLQNEKENTKDNIIKEFPTSLTWTALNALIMDRTEDINRELNTKLWLKQTYQSQLSDLTKKAEQRFWLISNILQKEDDRNYAQFESNLDFARRKELAVFDQNLKNSVPDLDKIVNDDWTIVYFDKNTQQIVSSYDPSNKNSTINYLRKDWQTWWQCAKYVNDIAQLAWAGRPFSGSDQSLQAKIGVLSRTDNVLKWQSWLPWSFMVYDSWNKFWHVGVITWITEKNWQKYYVMNDSNRVPWSEKVSTHEISVNDPKIKWFFATDKMLWWDKKAQINKPLSKEQRTQWNQVRTSFQSNPQVKSFEEALSNWSWLLWSLNSPSWASDIASIFSFMKSLDPTSTVRDTEFATAQSSAWIVPKTVQRWEQQINWERLTDEQRKDFAKVAKIYMENRAKSYDRIYDDNVRFLENQWIPSKDFFYTKASDQLRSAIDPNYSNDVVSEDVYSYLDNNTSDYDNIIWNVYWEWFYLRNQ